MRSMKGLLLSFYFALVAVFLIFKSKTRDHVWDFRMRLGVGHAKRESVAIFECKHCSIPWGIVQFSCTTKLLHNVASIVLLCIDN